MAKTSVVILGCGDIGCRLWQQLPVERFTTLGVRRNCAALPEGLEGINGDVTQLKDMQRVLNRPLDVLVLTFTPTARSDEGYQQGYVLAMQNVLQALHSLNKTPYVVLVSSTRVYGQSDGEWVDEQTPAEPIDQAGQCLLAMEDALRTSGLSHTVVRSAGIYSSQRKRLLTKLLSGQPQPESYSNRIHADDLARLLAWLILQFEVGRSLPNLVLAVDSEPSTLYEMQAWLGGSLGFSTCSPLEANNPHKRCSNELVKSLGFEFAFPTYREGYLDAIDDRC